MNLKEVNNKEVQYKYCNLSCFFSRCQNAAYDFTEAGETKQQMIFNIQVGDVSHLCLTACHCTICPMKIVKYGMWHFPLPLRHIHMLQTSQLTHLNMLNNKSLHFHLLYLSKLYLYINLDNRVTVLPNGAADEHQIEYVHRPSFKPDGYSLLASQY